MKEEIINELKDISTVVASINGQRKYNDIPEHYFDDLENQVLLEISLAKLISNTTTYTDIPDNYFSDLSEKVMSELNLNEVTQNQKIYSDIPSSYFENLSDKVISKVQEKREVKVISFYQKYKWVAAAAVFIGVVFTINKVDLFKSETNTFANNNSEKSYDEMLNELSEEDANLLIEQFSTEEDIQFIKSHEVMNELNLSTDMNSTISEDDLELELTEEDLEFLKTMM